ncbi:MAG: rRNA maturation RNase YbeY, partial [Candidatus Halalkalibacterium sp. M3_1C_030]
MKVNEPDTQLFNESGKEIPIDLEIIRKCLSEVKAKEDCSFSLLEVVYVDESGIVEINQEYLERDYVTDIISFRYDEDEYNMNIEGTLFCCAQRIYEQAHELNEDIEKEFKRILIHGLLHLCGYDDQSSEAKQE